MGRLVQRSGQSLIEVLVGIGLGALFVIGVAGIISPSLQISTQVTQVQIRTQLGNELIQNIQGWATGNWNSMLKLATGTTNPYYLNTATSSFSVASGTQSIILNAATYNRYFYLTDVYRDGNGNVTTTVNSNYDPSTKLVITVVNASGTATSSTMLSAYITRNGNNNLNQSSWAGGSGQNSPITLASTTFATSSNVVINATGSIQLAIPAGGTCQL